MFFDSSQLMMKTTPDQRLPPEEVLACMPGDEQFGSIFRHGMTPAAALIF